MEEKETEKVIKILEIARELGVEEEDIQDVSKRSKRVSISILSGIFGFVLGFIIGGFFSRQNGTSYPYNSGFLPGTVLTKTTYRILSIILGIIGFFSGFAISTQIPWSRFGLYIPPSDWGIWYSVFTKKKSLLGRGKKSNERV